METEHQDKKIRKTYDSEYNKDNVWLQTHFENNNYGLLDNEGGGRLFFCSYT